MYALAATAVELLAVAALSQAAPADDEPEANSPPAAESPGAPIIITGTRIVTPNRQSASPVETVRAEDFVLTGVPNVEQTLNQLPQLQPSLTNTSNNPGTGAATLDLRGLGSVRTLILVNGRRWIANDAGGIPEVDVNTIPSALIDRVDIVTGGASAVYGSDAVTGVINFILKPRLRGLHVEVRNNLTGRRDGLSSSADLTFGTGFAGGRGNLLLSAGLLKQDRVLQATRPFSKFALTDGCIVRGTRDNLGVGEAAGTIDCDGPGTEWGLVRAGSGTIPESRIGVSLLLPTASGFQFIRQPRFAPGGDIVRFIPSTDSFNFAPDNYLQVPLKRISANLMGSFAVTGAFEPYTELSFIRTLSPQQLAAAPAFLGSGADSVAAATLNLDNPFLSEQSRQALDLSFGIDANGARGVFRGPGGTIVGLNPAYTGDADGLVQFPRVFSTRLTGLGPRLSDNRRHAYRGLIGVRGELSSSWSYDGYFSKSHAAHDTRYFNSASARRLQQALLVRADPVTGQLSCIDPSNGCVPINVFGEQVISSAAADFLRIDPIEKTRVGEQTAELVGKGDLFELPGGVIKTAVGLNWRKTSYKFLPDLSFSDGDALGFLASTGAAGSTRVIEVFGEAMLPLLRERRFAQDLSVEIGGRASRYDSVGTVWTWKATGNWTPMRGIRFRGGLQKAVRAPNARELFEEATTNFNFINDPCIANGSFAQTPALVAACARNGGAGLPADAFAESLIKTSGSTDLKAETARTLTIGAVAKPFPWLDAALDYYDINIRDAIGVFGGGADFTVIGCILGGADPVDPLCQAFTRSDDGFVSEVLTPTANLARLRTRGVDWQVNARFPLAQGNVRLGLSGTRLIASNVQVNGNLPAIKCAGSFGGACGVTIQGVAIPRWKLFNQASWTSDFVTLSLRHRWFASTRDGRFALNEALGLEPPSNVPVNATRLQSRNYFDASAGFDVGQRFKLTLGVNNLTNAKPSLVGLSQVQANTDPSLYDVLGRRFFVALAARLP